jgi:hypothetical protein
MVIAALAQVIAASGAMIAAVLGVCLFVGAGAAALDAVADSLAYLELSDARRWRDAGVFGARGSALVGYAVAHAIFCWRPADGRAIAARAIVTATGCTAAVLMLRSILNAPPTPGCGMKWLADLAPFVLAAGFAVVEAAAWWGWRAWRARPIAHGAASNPAARSS